MASRYIPPCTQWGPPNASNRVLCLHGLTSSGQVWCRVGEQLAERGYFVSAPEMIGHGLARPTTSSTSFTNQDYAADLIPLLSTASRPYNVILGHSFGGPVALALVPYMLAAGASRVHVFLVEPALELTDALLDQMNVESVEEVTNVRTCKEYKAHNPLWQERDAMVKSFGATLCQPHTAAAVCEQNRPWSFTSLLPPASLQSVSTTILAGDPDLVPYFTPAEMQAINATRPDIRTLVVRGASHAMPREFPEAVVETVILTMQNDVNTASRDISPVWSKDAGDVRSRKGWPVEQDGIMKGRGRQTRGAESS